MNILDLAKKHGDWNGQTIEFNDVGLQSFVDAITLQEMERRWEGNKLALEEHREEVIGYLEEITKLRCEIDIARKTIADMYSEIWQLKNGVVNE